MKCKILERNHYIRSRSFTDTARSFLLALCLSAGVANAQGLPQVCGALKTQEQFGPYDYRPEKYIRESTYGSHSALLYIVEHAHFTPQVESLIRAKTGTLGGDLSYTLHAFPNHHRALLSMVNLAAREKKDPPPSSRYSIDCWFQRAISFRPDDLIVRLLYASYLTSKDRKAEVEQQLDFVVANAGDNAFTYHNIGLIYFDLKSYDKALEFAHKAYALGLGTPTLKDELAKVGKWKEGPEGADN